MSMVCPQCKQNFDKQVDCPTCGCRLMYHLSAFDTPSSNVRDDNWQQTSWGRIAVGLLLAQGLAFGSQNLITAGVLVSDESNNSMWGSLLGLALLHLVHAVSLLIGAAVCGAGQSRGILYGSLIGLIHGVAFLMVHGEEKMESLFMLAIYGQMALFAVLGAVGGWLGMLIWKPMPVLPFGGGTGKSISFDWSIFALNRYFSGRVHFGRVLVGIGVVILGLQWKRPILNFILEVGGGALKISSHMQEHLFLVEISAITTLAGAALAGATTFNGLKQGLFVGLGACVVLAGIQLGDNSVQPDALVLTCISTMFFTLAGGWFGGQLFPPVVARRRRAIHELY